VRPGDGGERLLDLLDADAVGRHGAVGHEGVQGVVHLVVAVDRGRRAVQLHQVEGVHPEVAARAVGPGAEVGQHVVLRDLVQPPAHLGGHGEVEVGVVGEEPADQRLAATVAVDVGGVEQGDALGDGGLEHLTGVRLRDVPPVGAQLPGAESHDRDGASGPAERA
jgi:hypothetical protein